jgi:hypothetical protein
MLAVPRVQEGTQKFVPCMNGTFPVPNGVHGRLGDLDDPRPDHNVSAMPTISVSALPCKDLTLHPDS